LKNRSIIRQGSNNLLPNTERILDLVLIDRIADNPYQPRTINVRGEDFDNLKKSIKTNGLDNPILVIRKGRKDSPDHYNFILIQGQRRMLAIKELGYDSILANILDFNEEYIQKQLPIHSLIENIQRQNLHFLDELKSLYLIASINFGITIVDGNYYHPDKKISILNLSEQLYKLVYIKPEYLRKKLSLYLLLHDNPTLQEEIIKKNYKLQDLLLNKRIRDNLFPQSASSTNYKNSNNFSSFHRTLDKLQNTPELSHFITQENLILPIDPANSILNISNQKLKILKKTINCYSGIIDQFMKGDVNFD